MKNNAENEGTFEEQSASGMSRRGFLKVLGGSAAVASAFGLAGCSASESASTEAAAAADGVLSWDTPDDDIPEDQIVFTVDAEVVVVGASTAGLCAALTAAETGLDVVVLHKEASPSGFAETTACWGTAHQTEIGLADEVDVSSYTSQWMLACSNIPRREFINMWLERNAADVEWALNIFEPEGLVGWQDGLAMSVDINWIEGAQILADKAQDLGASFYFSTPGVRLETDGSGRVVAVIGQTSDSEYMRLNASKGVSNCSGDYNGEDEMLAHYIPWAVDFQKSQPENVSVGDMHKAAHWVGAALDPAPHSCEIHYDLHYADIDIPWSSGIAWLRVNKEGERFSNEDVAYQYIPFQDINQTDCMHIDIFDDNFETDCLTMGEGIYVSDPNIEFCVDYLHDYVEEYGIDEENLTPGHVLMETYAAFGSVLIADTLEELAEKAGITDPDTFVATVNRYNELIEQGSDADFGKPIDRMPAIKQPPFYAIPRKAYMLSCLGGLTVNTSMEVLDENGEAVPGLYAAGMASGGKWFGGMVQPMDYWTGLPSSRACVTGRLAVETLISNS